MQVENREGDDGRRRGTNRIKEAKLREYADLEEQLRRADAENKEEADRQRSLESSPMVTTAETERTVEKDSREVHIEPNARDTEQSMTWEQRLEEHHFHDVVNSDDQTYQDIDDIPMDSEDVADRMISMIQNHVSEVWSHPRVTKLTSEYGLSPGFAYDIEVNDENCTPWEAHP